MSHCRTRDASCCDLHYVNIHVFVFTGFQEIEAVDDLFVVFAGDKGPEVVDDLFVVFAGDKGPEVAALHGAGSGSEGQRLPQLHRRGNDKVKPHTHRRQNGCVRQHEKIKMMCCIINFYRNL